MLETLAILSSLLQIARWVFLLAICILLYRRLSLPTLPWLGAHYVITVLLAPVTSLLLRRVLKQPHMIEGIMAREGFYYYFTTGLQVSNLLGALTRILIVLLVFSEIAFYVSVHYPEIKSRLLSSLLRVRSHVKCLGVILVVLTLVDPITSLALWLRYHPAGTFPY